MTPTDFRKAYLAAHYQVGDITFKLSPTRTQTKLFEGRSFVLITAHNPRSEMLSDAENAERHTQLVERVESLGCDYRSALGKSADSSWQEKSLAVFDLSLEQALGLGRQFAQHAIVFSESDKLGLVWCESAEADWRYPQILPE